MDRLSASFGYSVVTTLFLTLISLPLTLVHQAAQGTGAGFGDVISNAIIMLVFFTFVFHELQGAFDRQNERDRNHK